MSILETVLLAIALAMDCFTVSIASGIMLGRMRLRPMLLMACGFGLFQFLMPLVGWSAFNLFRRVASLQAFIESIDHWIAFIILAIIGVNMIREAFEEEEERKFDPTRLRYILILSVATSIDALAVGISFSCLGTTTLAAIMLPIVLIGMVSFGFSLLGSCLGVVFGKRITRHVRPELLGGIILILIGIKILLEHLFNINIL